jgi:glutaredoxin
MSFFNPVNSGFTIYSKSGCYNCSKVKDLIKSENFEYILILCDDYLIENRDKFLIFLNEKTGKEINMFPVVFYNGQFIGGYKETQTFLEKNKILEKNNVFEENEDF